MTTPTPAAFRGVDCRCEHPAWWHEVGGNPYRPADVRCRLCSACGMEGREHDGWGQHDFKSCSCGPRATLSDFHAKVGRGEGSTAPRSTGGNT